MRNENKKINDATKDEMIENIKAMELKLADKQSLLLD